MAEIDLLRENIQYEQLLGEGVSDTVLRGEYLIPDTHPDVAQVLMLDVKPIITGKDIMQDKIYVEGKVEYNILYLAKEEENRMGIQSVSYTDKFSNYIDIPGAEHNMSCYAENYIEHIESTIMNERKISVEGIIKLKVEVFKDYQYEIVKGIDTAENIQMLKKPCEIDKIVDNLEKEMVAKSNIKISMDKPQVGKILTYDINVHKKDIKIVDSKLTIGAFVKLGILYRGMDTNEVVYLEDEVFINEGQEMNELRDNLKCTGDFIVDAVEFDVKQDDLGENRIIDTEALVRATVNIMSKEEIDMIEDAYSPDFLMELSREKYDLNVLQGQNNSEAIIKENIELDSKDAMPVQVIMSKGKVCVTERKVLEDKVVVEGVVNVDVLYRSNDSSRYLYSISEELPFSCGVDMPGSKIDMVSFAKASLENIEAAIEANTIAIKCVVSVYARVNYIINKEFLVSIDKKEGEVPAKKASVTIYVVQPGDTLWSIAKRYHTSVDEIVKINNIENPDFIAVKQKIIIPGRAII